MSSVTDIVNRCVAFIERTIKNEIPPETCKEKEQHAKHKREKAVTEIAEKILSNVGPSQIK